MQFLFSVALLPLFIWLRRGRGQRWLARTGDWLAAPAAIYLLALPIIVLINVLEYLNRPAPWLARANEAVLPFYVIHQTVLLTVGFFVLSWPLPDLAKWAIIAVVSFTICVSLYEFVVQRINLLRVLFGMKPAARSLPVKTPAALPVNR